MIEILVLGGVILAMIVAVNIFRKYENGSPLTIVKVEAVKKEPRKKNYKITAFCTQCGRKLIYEKNEVSEYDWKTGSPTLWYIFTCPSKGWFNPDHDRVWYGYDQEGKLIRGKMTGGDWGTCA